MIPISSVGRLAKANRAAIQEQIEGADPVEVRAYFEQITLRMNQNDTLLFRTVARGADGTWICVNYWTDKEAMETLNAQAQSWTDEFDAISKLADLSTFELTDFAIGE